MALEFDGLLVFGAHEAIPGVCHLRVYRRTGRLLVAIVGELQGSPGPAPSPVIEFVAAAIDEAVARGEPFELISHHHQGGPRFLRVTFFAGETSRTALPRTLVVDGDAGVVEAGLSPTSALRAPRWWPIDDIDAHVGEPVQVWAREQYTAANLFGEAGRRLEDDVAAEASARALDFHARLSEFT